ncbi:hypothetical protein BGZ99_003158 [Dissophora globulifera]|uniref:Inner kinetochore subunit AME1 domain-containing protein n=1 Tax=Dissophora globulifera TaxID=979702 RepID=A0A9P6RQ90_9FUNG|nr:hypothetical protein BGZ99_003158 [Dissophora globulifera]
MADELAQRFKDKALARKRGAGTHQTKFRGFTLEKKSETVRSTLVTAPASVDTEASTTIAIASTSSTDYSATLTNRISRNDDVVAGLAKKYQEKVLARKRGAGTYQPEFRGFSLKKTGNEVPPPPVPTARESSVASNGPSKAASSTALGAKSTRSSNRLSGDLPNFSIAWGKTATVPLSDSGQRNLGRTGRAAVDQRPVIEDTVDDIGVSVDDYDTYDPIPDPDPDAASLFEDVAPIFEESAPPTMPTSSNDFFKRKWRPTTTSTATTTAPAEAVMPSRRTGVASTKKRRLIQEEVDENEDPLRVQNQATEQLKSRNDGPKKKPVAVPLEIRGQNEKAQAKTIQSKNSTRNALPAKETTSTSGTTTKIRPPGIRPLQQTTLMQLMARPVKKTDTSVASLKGRLARDELDESDGELDKRLSRVAKAVAKSKGASDSEATKRTVQTILQIEEAPISEMEVIGQAVKEVVDEFIDDIEDQAMAKELLTMRSELETALLEQVDLLSDNMLLKASVKKANAMKKQLRVRLLETQRQRQKTREELKRVRANFEREERARRRLEGTHAFLTDLEALRDYVAGSDDEGEDAEDDDGADQEDEMKTGLQSLIAAVGARCGGSSITQGKDAGSGLLGALQEFNQLLATTEKSLLSMPLVNPSQQTTKSLSSSSSRRKAVFSDDDEDIDYDFDL